MHKSLLRGDFLGRLHNASAGPSFGKGYRADIDGLRAVAVVAVVAFHAAPSWVPGGFVGVDIFFVISGFLISSLIIDQSDRKVFRVSDFYIRRMIRIFPTLLLVLFACLVFGWYSLVPEDYARLGLSVTGSAGFVENLILWAQSGYFDEASDLKPLLHIWSLGVEEQFYIFWPLLLWAIARLKLNRAMVFSLVVVTSFSWNVYSSVKAPVEAFFSPQTRFWELACGALAALTVMRLGRQKDSAPIASFLRWRDRTPHGKTIKDWLSFFGLFLITSGLVLIRGDSIFPGFWALLPVSGALAIILAGPNAWVNREILSQRAFVSVGLISYPLYLWHWPLLAFGRILHGGPLRPDTITVLVPAAFILAWLSFHFVEKPIRFGKNLKLAKVVVLASAMVGAGATGYVVYNEDGFVTRFPAVFFAIMKKPNLDYRPFDGSRECIRYALARDGSPLSVCVENQRPLVFVMGDSHAAELQFGLDRLQSQFIFGVDFATICQGVPVVLASNYGTDICEKSQVRRGFTLFAFEQIGKIKPDIVILHAAWSEDEYFSSVEQAFEKLGESVAAIKSASPASRIVVLGPVPVWGVAPQKLIYKAWLLSSDKSQVPLRLKSKFHAKIATWDAYFQEMIPRIGATYISAYRQFCNADGCLARLGETGSDVVTTDSNHLSPAASIFLLEKIRPELFALLPEPPRPRVNSGN